MFINYDELFVQPYISLKGRTRFTVLVNKREVGTITELKTKKWNLIYLFNLYFDLSKFYSFDYVVKGENDNIIGYIRKAGGFFKKRDIYVFDKNKELIATFKWNFKLTKLHLTMYKNNEPIWKINSGTMEMDYPLVDAKTEQPITIIRKRSPIYETVQENLKKGVDGFYIKTTESEEENFLRIATCIVLDFLLS